MFIIYFSRTITANKYTKSVLRSANCSAIGVPASPGINVIAAEAPAAVADKVITSLSCFSNISTTPWYVDELAILFPTTVTDKTAIKTGIIYHQFGFKNFFIRFSLSII